MDWMGQRDQWSDIDFSVTRRFLPSTRPTIPRVAFKIGQHWQVVRAGASVLGPLTCMVGYMVLNGSTKRLKRSVAVSALLAFLLLLLACLLTKYVLQTTVFSSAIAVHIAWVAWAGLYLLVFMSFGLAMVAAFQLRTAVIAVPSA
jgi:hypothetical protein